MKSQEETICFKINRALEEVELAINTRSFSPQKVARLLHEMRVDAQDMEDGLRLRKKIMTDAGLEQDYQTAKGKQLDPLSNGGVNKVVDKDQSERRGKQTMEFIVKEDGDIVYQQIAHAGVINIVEEIEDIDEQGIINGRTQSMFFGHPMAFWFSMDQLNQALEGKRLEVQTAFKEAIRSKIFADPKLKQRMLDAIGGTL